ncbi:MAG: hypothetical protein EP344_03055 [Bacteroidetes bacterium]|nr:MAG: hypothetical protein EP344_03055 [Bacteroidota bacterium]
MKKAAFLIFVLTVGSVTLALAQKEQTLANSNKTKGGFGGPFFLFSQADGKAGGGAGGGGGFIIDDFFIGGFGQGEAFGQRRVNNRSYDVTLGGGGFWLGYAYPSYKVLHLYSTLKLGWGSAALRRRDDDPFDNDDITDQIFMVIPEVGAEINLIHWFRLGLTAGYRVVGGLHDLPGFASQDFNSPVLAVTLRFGGFGYN